jgi:hypothetical protein
MKSENWTSFETSRGFQLSPKAGFRLLWIFGMRVSLVNLVILQQAVFPNPFHANEKQQYKVYA